MWGGFVTYNSLKIINFVRSKLQRNPRKADVAAMFGSLAIVGTSIFILIIYPGLLWKLPSTIVVLEVATAVMLAYLTELQTKHLHRLHELTHHQQSVDE